MENKIKILIIDDDKSYLFSITKFLSLQFKDAIILEAVSVSTAKNIIFKEKPQIIICDMILDDGNGIDILKHVRSDETLQHTYFILLTGNSEAELRKKSYEFNVDDYIIKPFDSDYFSVKIASAIRFINLQEQTFNENKLLVKLADELQKEIQDMIKLAVKFLQARIPASYDMLRRVAATSVWITETYGGSSQELIREIEIAAFLSQAGRIFLPDNMLKLPILTGGIPTDTIMYQVPTSGSEIVGSVRRLKNVATYIKHIYENFDGSGIPDRLQSWQIPLASRIIRVALDYEEFRTFQKKNVKDSIELIKKDINRLYDQRIVILMEQYVLSNEDEVKIPNEIALQLLELKPGMVTTRDVFTEKGLKLLPAEVQLNESSISKIINIVSTDPILGYIYVKQ